MIVKFPDKIKVLFAKKEYKRVGENLAALSLLNGIYMLSPLILIPYLIRIMGPELYGIYIFVWTFIYYYVFIINYGFDYTATKEISINRDNSERISEIYSTTFFTRLLLVVISFIILGCFLIFIPQFSIHSKIILLGTGLIIGQALIPTWIFQGMEEMKFVTIVNTIARVIPLVLIFLFFKSGTDISLVLLFQSIGFLSGGVFSHLFAVRHYKLHILLPDLHQIKDCLKSGWSMFLSTIGISLYRESNTIILGFVTNNYELVGYYALADKIIRLFQTIINSFGQALFPYFGKELNQNKAENINKYKKIGLFLSAFLLLCVLLIFILIPYIVKLYLGNDFPAIVRDVRIMSPVVFVGGLNYYLGIVGLVNLNHHKQFTTFVLLAGLVNIALCLILGKQYADAGASFSLLIAETMLLILITFYFNKKEKLLKKH